MSKRNIPLVITDPFSAMGLGLSIVKRLVEAMNGRVWCESEPGKGATFVVTLPVAVQASARPDNSLTECR